MCMCLCLSVCVYMHVLRTFVCICLCVLCACMCVCAYECNFIVGNSTGNKAGSSNSYPALGHQNSTRATLQTVVPTTATSHTAMVNANNDVIIIPSLQPTTNKSVIPGTGHILVTSHPPVRYHQDINHSPNMIVNNLPHQQPAQIQSPVAGVISLDSSKSKAKPVTQDMVTISSPTQPPRLSNTDPVASSS